MNGVGFLTKKRRLWLLIGIAAAVAAAVTVAVAVGAAAGREKKTAGQTRPTAPTIAPNRFSPEDFTYDARGYLTCTAETAVLGADISSFQGEIDWEQVVGAGIGFVMIRVGGRGYGQAGTLYEDERAQENYQGAKAAGLQVGAYFFSQAITPDEARQEASYALEMTKDWELTLPLAYDWEDMGEGSRTASLDKRTLTDCVKAFCRTVEMAGVEPMIYSNPDHTLGRFYLEELTDYRLWLAQYADGLDYPYRVDMWQYTNDGAVPGIPGSTDLNLLFSNPPSLTDRFLGFFEGHKKKETH